MPSEGGAHGNGLEQFTILTNARRIDPVGLVSTQLGAHEVSNLSGIDDADNMTDLVQRTRDAKTVAPGQFQTGVNSSMVPPVRCIRKALGAHLAAAGDAHASVFLETSTANIPSITVLSFHSSLQHELRFEQPCTQDLRSCASQDTVQSEQRSLEKRGLIYRTGSFAKGTQEAHRSPCCLANVFIC